MKRWSITTVLLIVSGSQAFAQQRPASGDAPFSSDLVLWSYMQEPQPPEPGQARQTPTPDPHPETQPQQNPTTTRPQSVPAEAGFPPTTQTFTGTISKEADSFILQASKTASYKLD